MKKTAILLFALMGACATDVPEDADESAPESEVLEQAVQKTITWSLTGPNKSAQQPKDDFAATVVCSHDGKGHAMAQLVLKNVKTKANYYGFVTMTLNGQTKVFNNVSLPVGGRSYPITFISLNSATCNSMSGKLSINWIEPV